MKRLNLTFIFCLLISASVLSQKHIRGTVAVATGIPKFTLNEIGDTCPLKKIIELNTDFSDVLADSLAQRLNNKKLHMHGLTFTKAGRITLDSVPYRQCNIHYDKSFGRAKKHMYKNYIFGKDSSENVEFHAPFVAKPFYEIKTLKEQQLKSTQFDKKYDYTLIIWPYYFDMWLTSKKPNFTSTVEGNGLTHAVFIYALYSNDGTLIFVENTTIDKALTIGQGEQLDLDNDYIINKAKVKGYKQLKETTIQQLTTEISEKIKKINNK